MMFKEAKGFTLCDKFGPSQDILYSETHNKRNIHMVE